MAIEIIPPGNYPMFEADPPSEWAPRPGEEETGSWWCEDGIVISRYSRTGLIDRLIRALSGEKTENFIFPPLQRSQYNSDCSDRPYQGLEIKVREGDRLVMFRRGGRLVKDGEVISERPTTIFLNREY